MRLIQRFVFICLFVAATTTSTIAQYSDFGDSRDYVRITVYPDKSVVEPGDEVRVAIIFDHQPKWHIHTNNPIVPPELGDPEDFIKTQLNIASISDESLIAYPELMKWPKPHATMVSFLSEPVEYSVFSERAIAYLPVIVRNDAKPGPANISINATYQACDEKQCVMPVLNQSFSVSLNVVSNGKAPDAQADEKIFADFPEHVWMDLDRGPAPIETTSAYKLGQITGSIVGFILGFLIIFAVVKKLRK